MIVMKYLVLSSLIFLSGLAPENVETPNSPTEMASQNIYARTLQHAVDRMSVIDNWDGLVGESRFQGLVNVVEPTGTAVLATYPEESPTVANCNPTVDDCNETVASCNATDEDCNSTMNTCNWTDEACNWTNEACVDTNAACSSTDIDCNPTNRDCAATDKDCNRTVASCNVTDKNCNWTNEACYPTEKKCAVTSSECNQTDRMCNPTDKACNATNKACNMTAECDPDGCQNVAPHVISVSGTLANSAASPAIVATKVSTSDETPGEPGTPDLPWKSLAWSALGVAILTRKILA